MSIWQKVFHTSGQLCRKPFRSIADATAKKKRSCADNTKPAPIMALSEEAATQATLRRPADCAQVVSSPESIELPKTVFLSVHGAGDLICECTKAATARGTNNLNILIVKQGGGFMLPNPNVGILWLLPPEELKVFCGDILQKVKNAVMRRKHGPVTATFTGLELRVLRLCHWNSYALPDSRSAGCPFIEKHPFRAFPQRRLFHLRKEP